MPRESQPLRRGREILVLLRPRNGNGPKNQLTSEFLWNFGPFKTKPFSQLTDLVEEDLVVIPHTVFHAMSEQPDSLRPK